MSSYHAITTYIYICYKFIKVSLGLSCLGCQYTINGASGTFLNFLLQFLNVTHLVLHNINDSNGDGNPLLMFEVLSICLSLVSFEYRSNYPISSDVELNRLLSTSNHEVSRYLEVFY
jgi:hypothetical protein